MPRPRLPSSWPPWTWGRDDESRPKRRPRGWQSSIDRTAARAVRCERRRAKTTRRASTRAPIAARPRRRARQAKMRHRPRRRLRCRQCHWHGRPVRLLRLHHRRRPLHRDRRHMCCEDSVHHDELLLPVAPARRTTTPNPAFSPLSRCSIIQQSVFAIVQAAMGTRVMTMIRMQRRPISPRRLALPG